MDVDGITRKSTQYTDRISFTAGVEIETGRGSPEGCRETRRGPLLVHEGETPYRDTSRNIGPKRTRWLHPCMIEKEGGEDAAWTKKKGR